MDFCIWRRYADMMKPLLHPRPEGITLAGVLHALADPSRRRILATLAGAAHPMTCAEFAATPERVLPKSTLSQHFSTLRECGLIWSERRGTSQYNTMRWDDFGLSLRRVVESILAAHADECSFLEIRAPG